MIKIFSEGDDFFHSLERDIKLAKKYIYMEFYIFQLKEVGTKLLELLIKKQKKSKIRIKVILDGMGTKDFIDVFYKKIQFNSIELQVYKPFRYKLLFKSGFHQRDHRKIVLIDDKILYTGGMNIKDVFSYKIMQDRRWRDTMIRLTNSDKEIEKIIQQTKSDFICLWNSMKKKFYFFRKQFPLLYPIEKNAKYAIFSSLNRKRRLQFRKFYYDFLKEAKNFICLATPYFIPPLRLIKILKEKSKQGVKIQILTAGNTDVWIARQAGRAVYSTLLKSGVQIFEYTERIFHSKHTITEKGVLIGSSNIDYRSFFHNLEIDFFTSNQAVIKAFIKQWEKDLKSSEQITLKNWEKRSIIEKITEKISYAFKYYL
ncbi:MAG: phospholipase D-like domain-containing protein [Leptonema sp. (in: bacteria)]